MGIVQSLFGGPRAPLQPKGPAPFAQPDERDRRALFWLLKRNTSYTAVKHNADLWSSFAGDFEKWLRSQDEPEEEYVTTYKYILDNQLRYERGLKRLKQGDRSVWDLQSSEGWLAKLNTGLVDRRMELSGPPAEYFEQFGIPASLVRAYFRAHDAAMACSDRETYSGMQPYQGIVFPSIAARPLLLALPFDTALPEPRWDVSFEPGKAAPKDGIYEMVNRDGHIVGGMGFFIKGQKAKPDEAVEFGPGAPDTRTSAFFWRLLWEDTRYKDGSVPPEEALYPLPEQSVSVAAAARDPQRARCEAGQPCPREGWWFTPAKAGSRRRFEQGEVMPDFNGDWGRTVWQWDEQQESASE